MLSYRSKVEKDLQAWERQGWVAAEGARAIRADLAGRAGAIGMAPVLAVLGAVLLATGAMTFVAAHWSEMPRLMRLALLVGGLWGAYGVSGWLTGRGHPYFAEAANLLGGSLFGVNIMLIGQMYHLSGSLPAAMLTWTSGVALAAVLLRSNTSFALAVLLAGVWTGIESGETNSIHWAYLPVWAMLFVALTLTTRWRPAYHLLAVSLSLWVIGTGFLFAGREHHEVALAAGLVVMAVAWLGRDPIDRVLPVSRQAICYGLAVAFAGLFAMQFLDWRLYDSTEPWRAANGLPIWLLAAAALALVLGTLGLGARAGNQPLVWLSYAGFSLELIALYFRTLGTLLDTSIFFLLAGVLVIALAWLAWRLRQHQLQQGGAP